MAAAVEAALVQLTGGADGKRAAPAVSVEAKRVESQLITAGTGCGYVLKIPRNAFTVTSPTGDELSE
jgi:hypothetical protein